MCVPSVIDRNNQILCQYLRNGKTSVKTLYKVYEGKIRLKESIIVSDAKNTYLKLISDLKLPYKPMVRDKNCSRSICIIDYIYYLENVNTSYSIPKLYIHKKCMGRQVNI